MKDDFFGPEKLSAMRLSLIKVLLKLDFSKANMIINQLFIQSLAGFDAEDSDQSNLLDEVIQLIVEKVKAEFSDKKFLWLSTLNHILATEDLGKKIASKIGQPLNELVISYIMKNYRNFENKMELDLESNDQLLPKVSTENFTSRDFYPFCEQNEGAKMYTSDENMLFISCLQFVELLKLANVVDPPPSLVNCAFGLLICDVLPPGVRVNAKRLALAMVASPEKYRSRRDQQRLTKYFESIDKLHQSVGDQGSSMSYNQVAEIFENIKAITDIAKKRVQSWQSFAENEKWISELLLKLSFKVGF